MKEPDISISITKIATIEELNQGSFGIRPSALMMRLADRLISQIWDEFERLENKGAEFECLELTATFRRGGEGS